eukprot:snap_masked-scaffold_5-processed-gene-10.1-mRNA-1 protein AED:1.00 eAED:1.00 QI:0/-1/0/0/-1/1/1/0/70
MSRAVTILYHEKQPNVEVVVFIVQYVVACVQSEKHTLGLVKENRAKLCFVLRVKSIASIYTSESQMIPSD